MAARLCPHCNVMSNFNQSAGVRGQWGYEKRMLANVEIITCHNCEGIVVLFSKQDVNNPIWTEWASYPATIANVDQAVPPKVAADFISAVNCFSIGEYKAAAGMFRRALQQILIDKGAKKEKIFEQINELASAGIINSDLEAWANEIRFWGNDGAHPSKDGLDELSAEEVQEVRVFVERMFDYVYIMPAKLAASRLSRDAKKQAPPIP